MFVETEIFLLMSLALDKAAQVACIFCIVQQIYPMQNHPYNDLLYNLITFYYSKPIIIIFFILIVILFSYNKIILVRQKKLK